MRISLDSPEIKQFNPDPAIHLWQKAVVCGRRPSQKIWKKTKNKENSDDNTESDAVSECSTSSISESDLELSDQADQQVEQESMPLNTQSQTIRDFIVCCYSECISHTRQAEKSA